MARDYTKYTVEGLGENLNKRQLVFTIVKDWVEKNNPSFEELQQAFPDEVQGSKGFIRKEAQVKTPKHFNLREPLKIKNGAHVVVSNQWGDNISNLIDLAEKLGYNVTTNSVQSRTFSNESESFSLSNDIYSGDIRDHIEDIIRSGDKERCQLFKKSVIDFINSNNGSYWIIPFINDCLVGFENKSDDEELGWDDCLRELDVSGKELDFNPKKKYSLFYNTYDENFKVDEDDDEGNSFFESVMKLNFSSSSDFDSLTSEEVDIFYNTSITTLYCTICKMCEENIRQDELVEIFLSVFNDEYGSNFESGDLIWEIISETLLALGVDRKSYEDEENLWRDEYLVNFDDIAEYLIDNDVFDNDYIPS